MGDTQSAQKEIFGKIQGFMAFIDTTEQKKSRENLEEWQDTFESLRDITNNPLPFLLELLKMLKSGIPKTKIGAKLNFNSRKKKNKSGKGGDDEMETTKKSFSQKHNLSPYVDHWLSILNDIIKQAIMNVLPTIDDILLEEIIKAFSCDVTTLVPVIGDGLTGPIVIELGEIDFQKSLFNDPNDDVGMYFYEQNGFGGYNPGGKPYPVNRFLRDLIYNGGMGIDTNAPNIANTRTIYGVSGKPLFDVKFVPGPPARLEISTYYKEQAGAGNWGPESAPPGPGPVANATKFTMAEMLFEYFKNVRMIEIQNLTGALLEVMTGFMSVRNKAFSVRDMWGLELFFNWIESVLEACDGDAIEGPSTGASDHQSELNDSDNFFSFTVEEKRAMELEVSRKKNNVLTLKSCGMLDIPIDNDMVDESVKDMLASQNISEQRKDFDLLLQRLSIHSAKKAGYDLGLGDITLPVEIDFKEGLIKKLPQILMYSLLNPKGVLPVVLVSKIMNSQGQSCSSLELFMKVFKRVLLRVIKAVLQEVLKYILRLVKAMLLSYIRKIIKEKLSEKYKKKIRIIRKLLDLLLPLILALQNAKNCQEIYNILLALLMANMPDIPWKVPPFLVAIAELRPGVSALGMFEEYIGKLKAQGIPTGDMPDGSANIGLMANLDMFQSVVNGLDDGVVEVTSLMGSQIITPMGPGQEVPLSMKRGLFR
jgi:hypothetical protein